VNIVSAGEFTTNHKQLELKYQIDQDFWRKDNRNPLDQKILCDDYFGEVNFETLRFELLENVDHISQCLKRIDLYKRIASINEGSKLE